MSITPKVGAPELSTSQASKEVTHNEALRFLEQSGRFYVIKDKDLTTPPGSPADGDAYIVAANGGAWAPFAAKDIAFYMSTGWLKITPEEGVFAWMQDENLLYYYTGSAWASYASGAGLGDVVGPASATDLHLAQFDGTTGKLIKDGGLALDTDGTLAANSDSKIASQKATKTYVDAKVAGLSWKQAVRAATTANGLLATAFANGQTIDGVTLATGDRILVKNQSTGSENGIYTVNLVGAPTRATDADSGAELVDASVYISEGTTLADTQWTCTTNAPITPGSTSLAFAQLTSGGVPTGAITSSGLTMATARLLGRTTASTGAIEEITPGATLALTGGALGVDLTHANAWIGKQDLGAGGDLTPAAAPSTTAIGYLGAPQNLGLDSGAVTLALTDCGKHLYHTDANARTLTIPANASVAFPIGTVIAGVNEHGAAALTIAITTDTLRWGTSTGSRTVAADGTFSLLKVAATVWRLTGDGIT